MLRMGSLLFSYFPYSFMISEIKRTISDPMRFLFFYVFSVKYIMKCDDDTFVNVPNLLQVLLGGTVPLYRASIPFYDKNSIDVKSSRNRLAEVKRLLTGFLFCEAKPIGDTSSKW